MKTIARLLRRLFAPRPRPMFAKPEPLVLGSGVKGARVLSMILSTTRADAIRARQNNYRRSVRRILDAAKN